MEMEDVQESLKQDLGHIVGEAKIFVTRQITHGRNTEFVQLEQQEASLLLDTPRIKTG